MLPFAGSEGVQAEGLGRPEGGDGGRALLSAARLPPPSRALLSQGIERVPTYRRGAIEYVLQVEASQKPRQVASPEEMLQR